MMRVRLIATGLLPATLLVPGTLATATPAAAEMYDPEYRSCSQGSTVAIVQCLTARTKAWDARLNVAYQTALQRVDSTQRDALRSAQRLWLQYRDANCRTYGLREGSLREIEAAECLRSMTAERAQELEHLGAA